MSSSSSSTMVEVKQHQHPQLPPYLRPPPAAAAAAAAAVSSSGAASTSAAPSPTSYRRDGSQHPHHDHREHHAATPPPPPPPSRVHTLDLKGKLAAALGNHGKQYWNALLHFCSAKISRDEFEQQARMCLRAEDGEHRVPHEWMHPSSPYADTLTLPLAPRRCQSTCTTPSSSASSTMPRPPCQARPQPGAKPLGTAQ